MNQEINFVLEMPRAEGGLLQALFVYANYRGRYCVVCALVHTPKHGRRTFQVRKLD